MIQDGVIFVNIPTIYAYIVSIVLSTISIKSNNKKIYKISNIVLIITIILFLVCLTVGSTVSRGY